MESYIQLANGYKVWTKTVGAGQRLPLLILHGGPGAGHDYLEPLAALERERPVVFYDQLGYGKSDIPNNRALWTIERFADEIDEVRNALGIDRCHILGQSWGGWLGIEYMLRAPQGLASFVLASTSASIPEFARECELLIAELPEHHRLALAKYGSLGEFHNPAYAAAEEVFYKRHLCRLAVWPECILRSTENLHHTPVYEAINGPNEFTTIGNLRYWDRTSDLSSITTPVLITCGRYDELGPACAKTLQANISNATMQVFQHSAHVPHIEEPDAYIECVSQFLRSHD